MTTRFKGPVLGRREMSHQSKLNTQTSLRGKALPFFLIVANFHYYGANFKGCHFTVPASQFYFSSQGDVDCRRLRLTSDWRVKEENASSPTRTPTPSFSATVGAVLWTTSARRSGTLTSSSVPRSLQPRSTVGRCCCTHHSCVIDEGLWKTQYRIEHTRALKTFRPCKSHQVARVNCQID